MPTRFEVRQSVCTVNSRWLECIFKSESARVARMAYDDFCKDHPGEYFELVEVVSSEVTLEFRNPKPEHGQCGSGSCGCLA